MMLSVSGRLGPPAAWEGLLAPPGTSGAYSGVFEGGLRKPPGASRGPPAVWGGPLQVSGTRTPLRVRMLGLVVGFASFLGCQPCYFQVAWGGLPSGPQAPHPETQKGKVAGFREKGPLGGVPAPAPEKNSSFRLA